MMTPKTPVILAIDTHDTHLRLALQDQEQHIHAFTSSEAYAHSRRLFPAIETLLQQASLTLEDIALWAAVRGPGSFTGIRIGLSAARSFAFLTHKPCLGLSALDLIAYGQTAPQLWVLMDARRSNVFACSYALGKPASEPRFCSLETLIEDIKKTPHTHLFLGSGALAYQNTLSQALGAQATFNPKHSIQPATLIAKATELWRNTPLPSLEEVKPLYLLPSQPERTL